MSSDKSTTLTLRLPYDLAFQLDALAAATDRSQSWLLERALEEYLDVKAWQVARIAEGLSDLEEGRLIEHETVMANIENWTADSLNEPERGN